MPLVIVKSMENFHVQDGRNNGSKSDHRKCDKLFWKQEEQGVTSDLIDMKIRTHHINNKASDSNA